MKSFIANLIARLANAAGVTINPATEDTLSLVKSRLDEMHALLSRIRTVLGDNLTTYSSSPMDLDIRFMIDSVRHNIYTMRTGGLSEPQYTLVDTTIPAGGSFIGSWIDTVFSGYKNLCLACSTTGTLTVSIQVSHDGSTVLGTAWSGSCTLAPTCVIIPYGYVRVRIDNTGTSAVGVRYMHKLFVC